MSGSAPAHRRGAAAVALSLSRRGWAVAVASALAGAAAGFAVAAAAPGWDVPALPAASLFRMVAVGDTGHPPKRFAWWDPQRAVGRALAAADRRQPADVFVLLGDNFYPDGLRADELEGRVAGNLVAPYCRFLDLGAPRGAEMEVHCPLPPSERRPIPVRAVLGNHDYRSEESPALQADAIGAFLSNWRLEAGGAFVEEHPSGVSVVYFDSTPGRLRRELHHLGDALQRTRGPWRIVVSHHPIETTEKGRGLLGELERAGVPVHLWLAGHDHNLQISLPGPPGPALQAVAGSGSHATPRKYPLPGLRFFRQALGYARVDLVAGEDGGEELQVALVETRARPLQVWRPARVVAHWGIARDLEVRRIVQSEGGPLRDEREHVADESLE